MYPYFPHHLGPFDPTVLIEGVLFRARYLGSTQLVCEGQPTKSTRMMQAEEAVSRIKVPYTDILISLVKCQKNLPINLRLVCYLFNLFSLFPLCAFTHHKNLSKKKLVNELTPNLGFGKSFLVAYVSTSKFFYFIFPPCHFILTFIIVNITLYPLASIN